MSADTIDLLRKASRTLTRVSQDLENIAIVGGESGAGGGVKGGAKGGAEGGAAEDRTAGGAERGAEDAEREEEVDNFDENFEPKARPSEAARDLLTCESLDLDREFVEWKHRLRTKLDVAEGAAFAVTLANRGANAYP